MDKYEQNIIIIIYKQKQQNQQVKKKSSLTEGQKNKNKKLHPLKKVNQNNK